MHMHAEQRKALMPDNLDRSIPRPGRTLVTAIVTYVILVFAGNIVPPGQSAIGAEQKYNHAKIARQTLSDHIRPGYRALENVLSGYEEVLRQGCITPDAPALEKIYQGFISVLIQWGRIQHIRFGPVVEENRLEKIAFWPDAKGLGRRQVNRLIRRKDPSVLDPATLGKKSVAVQGLSALEVVLYSAGGQPALTVEKFNDYRCRYAQAIVQNLIRITRAIQSEWSKDGTFHQIWFSPGKENPLYLTPAEVTKEIAQSYFDALEQIRTHKIAAPMGLRPNQRKATRPPFDRSHSSAAYISANISGVADLVRKSGVLDELDEDALLTFQQILSELEFSTTILDRIARGEPGKFTDPEIRRQLLPIGSPLRVARDTGGLLLLGETGFATRFNDSDGN